MIGKKGFTIVEVVVVIGVIAILASIVTLGLSAYLKDGRDNQRQSNVLLIAEALEKYYDENGEYPNCDSIQTNPDTTLKGVDTETFTMPSNQSSNALICEDLANTSTDVIAFVGDGTTRCISGGACLSWTIKYREESTGEIVEIKSRRTLASAGSGQITLTGSPNGFTSVTLSWNTTPIATSYEIQRATNASFTTGLSTTTTTANAATINSLSYNTQYHFRVRALMGTEPMGNWSNQISPQTWGIGTTSLASTANSATSTSVSWASASRATSYDLQCSSDNQATWTDCATSTGSAYTFNSRQEGGQYHYRIRGVSGSYTGSWSSALQSVNPITTTPTLANVTVNKLYVTSSWMDLKSDSNGRCLDAVASNSTATMHHCHGGTNQKWSITATGEVKVQSSGNCLNAEGTGAQGQLLTVKTCTGGAAQKWQIAPSGELKLISSGLCADVPGGTKHVNGVQLQMWTCNATVSQTFYFPTVNWSWGASGCPVGTVAQYQYRQRGAEYGYTGAWVQTASDSVSWGPSTQGFIHTIDTQGRCSSSYANGPWTATNSGNFLLAVSMAQPPHTYSATRHSNTFLSTRAYSSCTGGTSLYSATDLYTHAPNYYQYGSLPAQTNIWWRDYTGQFDWGYWGNALENTFSAANFANPSYLTIRTQTECVNTTTGRKSLNSGDIQGPTLQAV